MRIKIDFHKLIFIILIIYTFILPVDSAIASKNNIAYANYIAFLYIIINFIELFRVKKINIVCFRENKLVILLPVYLMFTLFFKDGESYTKNLLLNFIISYSFFFFSCINTYSEKEKKILKNTILLSVLSVLVVYILYGNTNMNGRLSFSNDIRTMDPNYFVVNLCLITSVLFYNVLNKEKYIFSYVFLIFILVLAFMTGSRGGMLALFGTLIAVFFSKNGKINSKIIFVFILPIIIYVLIILSKRYISIDVLRRFEISTIEKGNGTGRYEIWSNALKKYLMSDVDRIFFGSGFCTFIYIYSYDGHIAHNTFIQMLTESGILGLIIFIVLLYFTMKKMFFQKNYIVQAALIGILIGAISLNLITSRIFWYVLFLGNCNINLGKEYFEDDKNNKVKSLNK